MISAALIIYLLFLVVFAVVSFFGLYQMWQFGYVGDASKRIIALYILISAAIVLVSIIAFFVLLR